MGLMIKKHLTRLGRRLLGGFRPKQQREIDLKGNYDLDGQSFDEGIVISGENRPPVTPEGFSFEDCVFSGSPVSPRGRLHHRTPALNML